MIKLNKDLSQIPTSLTPVFPDLFPNPLKIPVISYTTHQRRTDVINAGNYIDTAPFNDRYKLDDIRTKLIDIYKSKCAYCEQQVEQYHIEHYRPKKVYYWLAYSWDNLILACPKCNENKDINFEIEGIKATFDNTEVNVRSINRISADYDGSERPKMVNPEVTDPNGKIFFQLNGIIESDDVRFAYTIKTCKIDRKFLNDNRRAILDRFREHIRVAFLEHSDAQEQAIAIRTIVRNFLIDSKNAEMEYLAFRRYAIAAGWLNEITKQMN